ncbi:ABC-three component system protein [Marinomonas primoryensis]|uniref:ABC-three component system protein n=1 Tax=Marinomonas primoryensis TaxID=178399 RepID=UPI0019551BF5|nr:ABC-three component system protein [Marinomonas primoryensis]
MNTVTKSILCDATPSWNGYNYQGKVGLYVCLENILIEARKGVDIPSFVSFLSEHHIEYEWIEDFAIKKNDTYLSLHQVKHKGENDFKDHVEAIATILYRKNAVLPDTDIFKYFTLKSRQKGDAAAVKASIKSELLTHKLIDIQGKLDTNWKVNILSVESHYSSKFDKCFSDFELLVQKAFSSSTTYFHTADNVSPPSDDISNISGIPRHFVVGLTNSKSLSCKGIYLSFDVQNAYELALSDDELNHKLEEQIDELLHLLHAGETFLEADVKLYKTALCALVDQNLVKRHQHIRDKVDKDIPYLSRTKPSIYFSDIVNELKNTIRKMDEAYWNLICRENFETAYREQLEEIYGDVRYSESEDDIELYNQYVERLESVKINVIDFYFPNNCVYFLRQIYPHKVLTYDSHHFYNSISNTDKIKSVFFDFIQEVTKPIEKLILNCHKDAFEFQPSCIDFNISNERRKRLEIDIVKKGLADNSSRQSLIHKNVDFIVVNSTG